MARKSKRNQQMEAPTYKQRYLFPLEVMEGLKQKSEERRRKEARMSRMDAGSQHE